MNKERYLNKLDQLSHYCHEFNLDTKVNQEIEKLKQELIEFKIKIPFVGRFNAGKSALLNTILGREVLKEEQKPETCLATEIKFGNDKVIAHYTDGTTSEHHSDILMRLGADGKEQNEIDINKCNYLEVYLPIPTLRELGKDLVLVDMPGFDSGIESHNKAILRYLSEGSLFMLVIDCEDGTIKTTDIAFLDELDSFNVEFKVLLNKTDKKPESQLEEIKLEIEESLQLLFYKEIEVCLTSIMNEQTPAVIIKAISNINKDKALENFFGSRLEKIEQEVLLLLETLKKASQLNTREIDETIDELNMKYQRLERKLEDERRELNYKLTHIVKNDIFNDLKNAILQQSSYLARSALSGEEAFMRALNEIVRPVLLSSTSKNVEMQFDHLVNNLETELLDINEVVTEIRGSFTLATDSINGIAKAAKTMDSGRKLARTYRAVTTGLAVFTSVIAPWLELILIFLPDILKIFGVVSEKKQIEKIKTKIENELVGQIIFKLTPEIEKSLIDLEEDYMAQLQEQFNAQLEAIKNTLEQAKKSKVEKIEQQKDYLETINNAIEAISEELVG